MRAGLVLMAVVSPGANLALAQEGSGSSGAADRGRVRGPSCRVSCGTAAMVITDPETSLSNAVAFRNCLGSQFPGALQVSSGGDPSSGYPLNVTARYTEQVVGTASSEPSSVACQMQASVPRGNAVMSVSGGPMFLTGGLPAPEGSRVVGTREELAAACERVTIECRRSGRWTYGAPVGDEAAETPKSVRAKSRSRRNTAAPVAAPADSHDSSNHGAAGSAHE